MAGTVKKLERTARLSFGELRAEAVLLDGSCHILLYGGQSPHIGCTVLAIICVAITYQSDKRTETLAAGGDVQ